MMEIAQFKSLSKFRFASICILLSAGAVPGAAMSATQASDPAHVTQGTQEIHDLKAELSSSDVIDGSVLRVSVRVPKGMLNDGDEVTGQFEDTKFWFYPASEKGEGVYEAIVGVPHNHAPGSVELKVFVKGVERALPLKITDAKYPSETLKVSNRHVNPKKKDVERIKKDIVEVGKIYSTITKQKFWKGPFVLPVNSAVTSVFGTKRVFNGKMQSYHNGLDLKAPTGTPIHAAGSGVVVLAKSLFFTGNTVLIDHGYGVVTLYAHMSELKVKHGEHVEAGQLLGLSGMTGRANGPHLHWGVVINKVKVNPADFLKVIQ
jgi:murein DD-endopeptidase MepM/ murein hydrolase activator NlpD